MMFHYCTAAQVKKVRGFLMHEKYMLIQKDKSVFFQAIPA